MSSFGVTPQGFQNRRMTDWVTDLNAAITTQFGTSVSLGPTTVLGQIIAIMAERLALVSEAVADTYASQDPAAAEGVAVDYQLALLGLTRQAARATATNPVPDMQTNGIVLPGLVLYGTPGTVVPAASIIQTTTLPVQNFTLDANVTIGLAQNALQQLVFSQAPTAGSYTLGLLAPSGTTLTTASLPYGATAAQVQAAIVALQDTTGQYPFTDVAVAQSSAQVMAIAFGAGTVATGQTPSAALAQAKMVANPTGLVAGLSLVNLSVTQSIVGQPAQGTGSATCTTAGQNAVSAGILTVIGSGLSGWTGVNNPLDCVPGQDVETDTAAQARRLSVLAERGSGTVAGIVSATLAVSGVTSCLAFQNTTQAALQTLSFSAAPTGTFQLVIGEQTTAAITVTANSQTLSAAINALSGLDLARITGNLTYGFTIDFFGSFGGQPQPAIGVVNNNTGVTITQGFARPAKSVEVVVQGGADADVAAAILASVPVGIATYGAAILRTAGSTTAGSTAVTLASLTGIQPGQGLQGLGLQAGSLITGITGDVVTLSIAALATYSSVPMIALRSIELADAQDNPHVISFSRPTPLILFVQVNLVTNYFNAPGTPSSGVSPTATFDPASLAVVQANIVAAAQAVNIGGLVTASGTTGLASAFRNVTGVLDATVAFDVVPNPTNTANIQLLAAQVLSVEQQNIQVSFS